MKSILKADLSRAFKNWKFPLAVFLMFLVWELNSKRFEQKEDVLYLFINVWGRSITYLMAILISSIPFCLRIWKKRRTIFCVIVFCGQG